MAKAPAPKKFAAENRKARFNYEILDTLEAGIALTGTEIKALRTGKASIVDAYASHEKGGIWLINAYIPEYLQANRFNHEPRRPRQLLLHAKEIDRLAQATERVHIAGRGGCALVVPNALSHLRFNQSRADDVEPQISRRVGGRCRTSQADDPGFGRGDRSACPCRGDGRDRLSTDRRSCRPDCGT
jgi:hypothetical protein